MKLPRIARLACLGLFLVTALRAQSPDPDGAKIVTEDIDHFWVAFDKAGPAFPAETFQKEYLDKGSIGLQDFVKLRIQNAEKLAKTCSGPSSCGF